MEARAGVEQTYTKLQHSNGHNQQNFQEMRKELKILHYALVFDQNQDVSIPNKQAQDGVMPIGNVANYLTCR